MKRGGGKASCGNKGRVTWEREDRSGEWGSSELRVPGSGGEEHSGAPAGGPSGVVEEDGRPGLLIGAGVLDEAGGHISGRGESQP